MSQDARWSDLGPRIASAAVLGIVALAAVLLGGPIFLTFVCVFCGLMVWEVARMFDAKLPIGLGILAGIVCGAAAIVPQIYIIPLLLGLGIVVTGQTSTDRPLLFAGTVWIGFGALAFLFLRQDAGLLWFAWLVLVVIVSDVAGYFAGRFLGGPKFWPRISPKKTWSGTVAGWFAAALIGAIFSVWLGNTATLVLLSVIAAFAGQMGDIAQSAVKRRRGIKDSSNLIPGHGGVFDRFDAMLGAGAFVLLVKKIGLVSIL